MKIKICGMKYKDNIKSVARLRPDYLGFIFYKKSKRNFESDIPKLSDDIKKIGVFVNEKIDIINQIITKYQLDGVQLHGDESAEFCEELKSGNKASFEIIKAFAISETFDFEQLKEYLSVCNYFLFDTKGEKRGGNGTLFDWKILEGYRYQKPFFLSGGIGLSEVDQLQSFLKLPIAQNCHAIDLNSRFESEPGIKRIDELQKFMESINKII